MCSANKPGPSAARDGVDSKTEPDVSPPKWDLIKHVGILTGSQLMLNMGFSQMVPVMPLFAAQMGGHLGATGVGMVLSAPSFATLLLNVPLGRLCDVVGRKPLMWAGTALTAAGTISTGFVGSLATLVPCRLLVGAGSSASMTGSGAYLADLSDRAPQHRARIMGLNQMIVGSVWVVGPAIGGWLAETYGYRNSFIIAGVGSALCSLGYMTLPETLQRPETKVSEDGTADDKKSMYQHFKEWRKEVSEILECKNQQALIALACVFPIRYSAFATAVALHASSVMGGGPKEIGFMFTALALSQGVAMPLGSWLADKTKGPRKTLVVSGGLASCASFATLAFASTQVHFLAAMAAQGFFAGLMRPAVGAFTAEITPAHQRGQAMSLQRQAGSFLSLIGPVSMGALADLTSCTSAIMLGGGLMAGCHVAYGWLADKIKSQD